MNCKSADPLNVITVPLIVTWSGVVAESLHRTTHTITHAPLDSTLHVMCQPPPSHNTSNMAYKSFTKLTLYSSTGCPPLSLSVTVTCTSLSDNALVATVPMTGGVYREREKECYEGTY